MVCLSVMLLCTELHDYDFLKDLVIKRGVICVGPCSSVKYGLITNSFCFSFKQYILIPKFLTVFAHMVFLFMIHFTPLSFCLLEGQVTLAFSMKNSPATLDLQTSSFYDNNYDITKIYCLLHGRQWANTLFNPPNPSIVLVPFLKFLFLFFDGI